MHRCLQLAEIANGRVAPNPMVGAVLVHEDRVIGEGFHEVFGKAHAEVNCINSVKDADKHLLPQATLYVSLEPCNHYGKTPPCTDLIIASGIKHVVVGSTDPYEKVKGTGIQRLREAGINVETGLLEKECDFLNRRFFTFHRRQRPYIILKWAKSGDGYLGELNKRTAITSPTVNTLVHKWRGEEGAIVAGSNTIVYDDPQLTTRLWEGNHPLRVVLDPLLQTPADAKLLQDEYPAIIINGAKHEEAGNKLFYQTSPEENYIAIMINLLHARNIISVMVEGGSDTLSRFIAANMWDEARVLTNPAVRTNGGVPAPIIHGEVHSSFRLGDEDITILLNPAT